MSILAQIIIAMSIFAAGGAAGVKWHVGIVAQRELAAQDARETDAKQQRQLGDHKSLQHVKAVATIANQLGDAREQIAKLSDRPCLSPDAVRVLNAIGGVELPAAAGQPDGAPGAAAADPGHGPAGADARTAGGSAGTGLRYTTEQDAGRALGQCRAGYASLASQLNQILDIEARRQGEATP